MLLTNSGHVLEGDLSGEAGRCSFIEGHFVSINAPAGTESIIYNYT